MIDVTLQNKAVARNGQLNWRKVLAKQMMRWIALIFGVTLMVMSLFLAYHRRSNYYADSTSVVVVKHTDQGSALIEYNFIRRQKTLFKTEAIIQYFDWTADGEWILVITNHSGSNRVEIWRVERNGSSSQMLYSMIDWNLLDKVRLSPQRNEFVFIEQDVNNLRAVPMVHHMSLEGDVLDEYPLEGVVVRDWQLRWQTADTIALTRPLGEIGYRINLATHTIQQIEVDLNDQFIAASTNFNVAPNEQWRIVTDSLKVHLVGYGLDPTSAWLYESTSLYYYPIVGWSTDSQRIAVNAETVPIGQTAGATDIYITSVDAPDFRRLTHDERRKGFITTDTLHEFNVSPFSPAQHWILFGDNTDPHQMSVLHAVRTDGSRAEITNLVPPGSRLLAAQWSPPLPPLSYKSILLFLGGVFVACTNLGIGVWNRKRDAV